MKTKMLMPLLLILPLYTIVNAQSAFQVVVKGTGDPILLFPGFGCTGEVWNETVAALSKTNECHVFTFAGFGGVPPIQPPWLSKIKDEILVYVKEKKLKKPILLGHSLGGTLSLWLASSTNNTFKKVIVVDALPATAALMIPNYKGDPIGYDNPQSKMMLTMDSVSFAAMNVQSLSYLCLNKDKQKVIAAWLNKVDRKTYVYGYVDMLNLDLREQIAAIKIPVIVLAANYPDAAMIRKNYELQYAKLQAATIRYVENSAHFIMFDQPTWFVDNVKQIVK